MSDFTTTHATCTINIISHRARPVFFICSSFLLSVLIQQQLERRQRQQLNQQRQTRTLSDENIQLEEDVEVAREAAVWLVRRVGSLPTSRSFLNLGLCLLSAMRSPTVYQLLGATWHFKVRYGQCVIAEALAGVAEEDVAAFVEAIVRGNVDVLRCKDISVLLPDAHDLRTNNGAVIIRNALKRECDLSDEAQVNREVDF